MLTESNVVLLLAQHGLANATLIKKSGWVTFEKIPYYPPQSAHQIMFQLLLTHINTSLSALEEVCNLNECSKNDTPNK